MSGLEVVGVVLGAVPIIISCLEGYNELNSKLDIFFKRAFHVNRMINALYEQQSLIESDLKVLLSAAGVCHFDLSLIRIGSCQELLGRVDISEEIKNFLGSNYDRYVQALSTCEEILFRVARAIGGLKQGPLIDNGELAEILKLNPLSAVQSREFRKRLKFTMRKAELQKAILDLNACTLMLSRLRVISNSIHEQTTMSVSQKTMKMVRLAQKIRGKADSLHWAISRSWRNHCHPVHDAHLYLDIRFDRLDRSSTRNAAEKNAVEDFEVGLEGAIDPLHRILHVGRIKMVDLSTGPAAASASGTSVRFNVPSNPVGSARELADICQSIVEATQTQKILKLFLSNERKLLYEQCDPSQAVNTSWRIGDSVISLQQDAGVSASSIDTQAAFEVSSADFFVFAAAP